MALYSKKQYEEDMDTLEKASQQVSKLIACGEMTGLRSLIVTKDIEQLKRECKSKLLRTRWILTESELQRKAQLKAKERIQELEDRIKELEELSQPRGA